ncbi:8176_t:CDS:2, partial [Racocetra persica]
MGIVHAASATTTKLFNFTDLYEHVSNDNAWRKRVGVRYKAAVQRNVRGCRVGVRYKAAVQRNVRGCRDG